MTHDAERAEPQGSEPGAEALFELYSRQDADDDAPVSVTFRLQRDLDKRLDRYLVDRVPFLSRTTLQRLIREKAVTVNGRVPKPSTRLHRGDEVVAMLPPPPSNEIGADEIPLDILHEDEHLIVINKQADLIVHPARSIKRGTLINALAWHFLHSGTGSLSAVGEEIARPGVVHRLDRHTTGVIVCAKCDVAHWRLAKEFEARRTRKRYLALVHGLVEPPTDLIDLPLGKHPTIRERYAVRWDESGKPSRTIVHVLEHYRDPGGAGARPRGASAEPGGRGRSDAGRDHYSLVELDLLTGRTHQIRVHLSHRGWPIVGDVLYGGRPLTRSTLRASSELLAGSGGRGSMAAAPADSVVERREGRSDPEGASDTAAIARSPEGDAIMARQALHAALLEFRHPVQGHEVSFTAMVPADFRAAVEALRKRGFEAIDAPGATLNLAALGIPRVLSAVGA